MTTFFEQARTKTALWGESLRHVQRLAASWQALSDLCFSDLLLLAPVVGEDGSRSVVLAQVRPTTGQTVYPMDLVGAVVDEVARPLVSRAFRTGDVAEGDSPLLGSSERAHVQCIPVRHAGAVVALVAQQTRMLVCPVLVIVEVGVHNFGAAARRDLSTVSRARKRLDIDFPLAGLVRDVRHPPPIRR